MNNSGIITTENRVTGISASNDNKINLKIGTMSQLSASVVPYNADNQTIIWESSDYNIASVDENGNVIGISKGDVSITAITEDGNKKAVFDVGVYIPVSEIILNTNHITIIKGEETLITAETIPEDADTKQGTLKWSQSNSNVSLLINKNNCSVIGSSGGTTRITVETADGNACAYCDVTVIVPATNVYIRNASNDMAVGEKKTLEVSFSPYDTTEKSVTWSSSNEEVATIDETGQITALKLGTTTITATTIYNGISATCKINVIVPVSAVALNESSIILERGTSTELIAEIKPSNATRKEIYWSSSNEEIATVDKTGKVTGNQAGIAFIYATSSNNLKASCKVTVKVSVTGITLDKNEMTLPISSTETLTAVISPDDATNKAVIWSSSDEQIASVDENGTVTAIQPGTVEITVNTVDGNYSATCGVHVFIPVESISLDKTNITISEGLQDYLVATILPEDASNKTINWASSDEEVAIVDSNGTITAIKSGNATITATTTDGGHFASCDITVLKRVSGIAIDQDKVTLGVDEETALTVTVSPEEASDKSVNWISSDEKVAVVDQSGVIKAISVGNATITATTSDGGYTANCSVIVVRKVKGLEIDQDAITLEEGDVVLLVASVIPEDASDKTVYWMSSNEDVATVDQDGTVTAIGTGDAIITVTSREGGFNACCYVTVFVPVTRVTLDKNNIELIAGETAILTASVLPENASNKNIIWRSSNTNIVNVDEDGILTAQNPGKAIVTAISEDGHYFDFCEAKVSYSLNNAIVDTIPNQVFTQIEITPELTIKHQVNDEYQELIEGTDYTLDYENNTNAGVATITATGLGIYTGSLTTTFEIIPKSINDAEIIGLENSNTYIGKAITPSLIVEMETYVLDEDVDYTIQYSNNENAGMATVAITGIGNYEGTITKTFTINKATQSITASNLSLTYPNNGKIMASGNKGALSYASSNTAIAAVDSAGNVTVKGAGTVKITILAAATDNYDAATKTITVTVGKAPQTITAKAAAFSIAVGKTTTVSTTGNKGTVTYKSSDTTIATVNKSTGKVTAKKVGTVKITATAAATTNYKSTTKTVTIKIVPTATAKIVTSNLATGIKLTWKAVTGATGYKVYRGSTLLTTINSGSTVTFTDTGANTNGTKYTFKVYATASTGTGPVKSVITYRVARPVISSASNTAAGKMTVKWGKNDKATGYYIQYGLNKTFENDPKLVNITKNSTVSKVIGNLTKGKTYYVRMRTYKTVDGTKIWSAWSVAKTVKITK